VAYHHAKETGSKQVIKNSLFSAVLYNLKREKKTKHNKQASII
jgi:hypothetical protein